MMSTTTDSPRLSDSVGEKVEFSKPFSNGKETLNRYVNGLIIHLSIKFSLRVLGESQLIIGE